MAKLVAFDEINFSGQRLEVIDSVGDLSGLGHGFGQVGNWNDEIQSFYIESGSWRLFENTQYGGLGTQTFHAGDRIANCKDAGFPNKWVSSIQKVGD